MRRLSEFPQPVRYALCPTCEEEFIDDVQRGVPACPNDGHIMLQFLTKEALENFHVRTRKRKIDSTPPTAQNSEFIKG